MRGRPFLKGHTLTPKGALHPRWKGGKRIHKGYVELYSPNHPAADSRSYVVEHRLVMEQMLGRYLTSKEHVHHIDGNKQNNNPSNLELHDHDVHLSLHAKLKPRDNKGKFIPKLH